MDQGSEGNLPGEGAQSRVPCTFLLVWVPIAPSMSAQVDAPPVVPSGSGTHTSTGLIHTRSTPTYMLSLHTSPIALHACSHSHTTLSWTSPHTHPFTHHRLSMYLSAL